jgi:hypothetical protein
MDMIIEILISAFSLVVLLMLPIALYLVITSSDDMDGY